MINPSENKNPQLRENADPHESLNPIPKIVLVLIFLLLIWAIYYIRTTQPNTPPELGDKRTLSALIAKPVKSVNGEEIYTANCVACHQATGIGIPGVFPPLAGSEWVLGKDSILVQIILHGISGNISVKGATYNGSMPTFKEKFSDAELAALTTFLRSHWENATDPVTPETVQAQRTATQDRAEPWAGGDELARLK